MPKRVLLNSVILGFTGPIGSGSTYIAKGLAEESHENFVYFCLSDFISEALQKEGNTSPSTQDKQNKGNELRKQNGAAHLALQLMELLSRNEITPGKFGLIVDGIKNEAEVNALRQWPNFYLFSVQADTERRKLRCLEDGRFATDQDFDEADSRDQMEQFNHGQQVKKCDYIADIVLNNSSPIPKHDANAKREYIRSIYAKYVELILRSLTTQDVLSSRQQPDLDELCMTLAYSMSKRSSCIKRQVGAIIIELDRAPNADQHSISEIPFIISNGFNEIPLGLKKCIFDAGYEMCYRDHLQEKHAEGMKFCPKCGKEIALQIVCQCSAIHNVYRKWCPECKHELNPHFTCESCGVDVFSTYLPGGKDSPGKLMDMCRALHAEEMALLQLAKSNRSSNENLILYSTTQPCNLCANKIVAAGIKNVIYAEPYSMKQAEEILEKGGVERKRFQGVKSSAYFRLYR